MKILSTILLSLCSFTLFSQVLENDLADYVANDDFKNARKLVKKGANINFVGKNDKSILEIACSQQESSSRDKFIRFLLKKGVECDSDSVQSNAHLQMAFEDDKIDLFTKFIERGATPDYFRYYDITRKRFTRSTSILLKAVRKDKKHFINAILESGISPNQNFSTYKKDKTLPLIEAVAMGDLSIVTLLVIKGKADITLIDPQTGYNALEKSIKTGNLEIFTFLAEELQKKGFDFNAKNSLGEGLLHILCSNPTYGSDDIKILELLCNEYNCDIELKDKNENTPLILAIKSLKYSLAQNLLNKGADITTPNAYGETAKELILQSNNTKLLSLISIDPTSDEYINAMLVDEVAKNNLDEVKVLLEKGAKPKHPALAIAIIESNYAMIDLLLVHGANPNEIDNYRLSYGNKFTSMEYAFKRKDTPLIQSLIHYGYDLKKIPRLEKKFGHIVPLENTNSTHINEDNSITEDQVTCSINSKRKSATIEITFKCDDINNCLSKYENDCIFSITDSLGNTLYTTKLKKKDFSIYNGGLNYTLEIDYQHDLPTINQIGIHTYYYVLTLSDKKKNTILEELASGKVSVYNLEVDEQVFVVRKFNAEEKLRFLRLTFKTQYTYFENDFSNPEFYYQVFLKSQKGGEVYTSGKNQLSIENKPRWNDNTFPPTPLDIEYLIPYSQTYEELGNAEIQMTIQFFAKDWGENTELIELQNYTFNFEINKPKNTHDDDHKDNHEIQEDEFTLEKVNITQVEEYIDFERKGIRINFHCNPKITLEHILGNNSLEFYPTITNSSGRVVFTPTSINEQKVDIEEYETYSIHKNSYEEFGLYPVELFIPLYKLNLESGTHELNIEINAHFANIDLKNLYSKTSAIEMPQKYLYVIRVDTLKIDYDSKIDLNRSFKHQKPDPYWNILVNNYEVFSAPVKLDDYFANPGEISFCGFKNDVVSLSVFDSDVFWPDFLGKSGINNFSKDTILINQKSSFGEIELLKYHFTQTKAPIYNTRVLENQIENGVTGAKIFFEYEFPPNSNGFTYEFYPKFSTLSSKYTNGYIANEKKGNTSMFFPYADIMDTCFVGYYLKLNGFEKYFDKNQQARINASKATQDFNYELIGYKQTKINNTNGIEIEYEYTCADLYSNFKLYTPENHYTFYVIDSNNVKKSIYSYSAAIYPDSINTIKSFIPYYIIPSQYHFNTIYLDINTRVSNGISVGTNTFEINAEIPTLKSFDFYLNEIVIKKTWDVYQKQRFNWSIYMNGTKIHASIIKDLDNDMTLNWNLDEKVSLKLHKDDHITLKLEYKTLSESESESINTWNIPISRLKSKHEKIKLNSSKYTKKGYLKY